jgi:hypothetical protein
MANTATLHQDRAKELRDALQQKGSQIQQMSAAWKETTGPDGKPMLDITTDEHKSYLAAVKEAAQIREALTAETEAKGIMEFLGAPEGTPAAGSDAASSGRGQQYKTLGQEFLESETYREMKAASFRYGGEAYSVERAIDGMQVKDVFSALGGNITIPGFGQAQNLGWTDRTLRPGRVRDLFPAERTQASILYGIRETGYTNRARTVPQRTAADGTAATGGATDVFGLKPKSELSVTQVTYPIATIAHIMYVHRETLDDEPRLRGLIDRDMVDGVKMAEDAQLLYGDGVGSNLTGLMNTPGIQTYTGLASDKRSAQSRRAATRALLAYFQPTGVVMHPYDWESLELETDANGAYTVALSVAVGGEQRVWRLNVVSTPAITAGQALIGAFGTGAKVYDREQVNVMVSTENRDFFERNTYTIRAEERVGLVVDRPESFVRLTLTTPT